MVHPERSHPRQLFLAQHGHPQPSAATVDGKRPYRNGSTTNEEGEAILCDKTHQADLSNLCNSPNLYSYILTATKKETMYKPITTMRDMTGTNLRSAQSELMAADGSTAEVHDIKRGACSAYPP